MTVTAKGLDGSSGSISSGEGVEEEDTSAGFVKYCPIVLIKVEKFSEDCLESIPLSSPSVKIQIIGGKVYLR